MANQDESVNNIQLYVSKKRRSKKTKKADAELIELFWNSPPESRFGEDVIALVIGLSIKTMQCNRWRGIGIPFYKVGGRILYKKEHVTNWLNSFNLCESTSQYEAKEASHDRV